MLSWWGIGHFVSVRTLTDDRLLAVVSRLCTGLVLWALLVLALGLTGLLRAGVLLGMTVVLALAGLVAIARAGLRWPQRRNHRMVLGVISLALVVDLVGAAVPPTSADALSYHLALPALSLRHGHLIEPFWQWLGFDPNLTELVYTQGLAVGGGPTASALGAVFAVLATIAVYGLARELGGGNRAGGLGAALFVLQGIVTWEATGAFVELGTSLFTALAAWHVVRAARSRAAGSAMWSGGAAGAAAATKYTGLFALVAVAGILAVTTRSRRAVVTASLAAVVVAGAWYLRNGVVTGNPLYPYLFGGKDWTPASNALLGPLRHAYGDGVSPLRLPLLPLDLIRHGGSFDRGQYVDVLIFPLSLFAFTRPGLRDRVAVWCGGIFLVVAWWVSSQQARFLLPALALLAAVAGSGIAAFAADRSRARILPAAVLVAAAVVWAVPSAALMRPLVRVAFGLETHAHFIQRLTGTYDALQAAGRSTKGTLALGYESLYYVPRDAVYLGAGEFAPDVPREVYLARLRELGVYRVLTPDPEAVADLSPIRPCLHLVRVLPARLVTSRTRGTSVPFPLDLMRIGACRAAP